MKPYKDFRRGKFDFLSKNLNNNLTKYEFEEKN